MLKAWNFKATILGGFSALIIGSSAIAGPDDPSRFEAVHYEAQNVLYDWNYATPEDGLRGLGFIHNHIKAMREFGDISNSKFVVVSHGNDLHAFSRLNREAFPDAYEKLKELSDMGVEFHICRNAAKGRGYEPEDFYDMVTVVPAAVIDIAKYQDLGYSYIFPALYKSLKREADIVPNYPELAMSE